MIKVYSSQNALMVGLVESVLKNHHVPCVVKNGLLAGAVGELPPTECWPELWIMEDELEKKARGLVAEALALEDTDLPPWTCTKCGESCEGQYEFCWNCGEDRPGDYPAG